MPMVTWNESYKDVAYFIFVNILMLLPPAEQLALVRSILAVKPAVYFSTPLFQFLQG